MQAASESKMTAIVVERRKDVEDCLVDVEVVAEKKFNIHGKDSEML